MIFKCQAHHQAAGMDHTVKLFVDHTAVTRKRCREERDWRDGKNMRRQRGWRGTETRKGKQGSVQVASRQ